MVRNIIITIFFVIYSYFAVGQNSVLSTGKWYKIGISKTSVYKIDRTILRKLGVNTSKVDPRNIRLFGSNFEGILPQDNSESRPFDLSEIAIYVSGESDGKFDKDDYILFYVKGADKEKWTADGLEYAKNIYSDSAYYFLNISNQKGKRITNKQSEAGSPDLETSSYNQYVVFEEDKRNLISSGRLWLGDALFGAGVKKYTMNLIDVTGEAKVKVGVAGQSTQTSNLEVFAGSQKLGKVDVEKIFSSEKYPYEIKASYASKEFSFTPSANQSISVRYVARDRSSRCFLDYCLISYKRRLNTITSPITFRSNKSQNKLVKYKFNLPANIKIWDISNLTGVRNQLYANGSFQSKSTEISEYIAFNPAKVESVKPLGKVANQNLKSQVDVDGVIITHPLFYNQAKQLAQHHFSHDKLVVQVATTQQIFNEFSSGRQDITAIRDYIKFLYEKGNKLKYALLFGDCSYDYKRRVSKNTNFVPTYQSRESFHPVLTYCSDDYYGFLEKNEGEWEEHENGNHTLDIGVGRLPVKSIEEAKYVVDKIKHYSTNPITLGNWRNQILYVADDEDGNLHARDAQNLATKIDTTYKQFYVEKLMLDAFNRNGLLSKERSPRAEEELKRNIKKGAVLVNYMGHGNEKQWALEKIFSIESIEKLTNLGRLPIFLTATCDFGKYDDPQFESGAEKLINMPSGGGIALLTTTRPVYASSNLLLNKAFHTEMFRVENNRTRRLGDVVRATKNASFRGVSNRNFTLLGDPMLRPNIPINSIQLDSKIGTLNTLEKITINGKVKDGFNGKVTVTILDGENKRLTQGKGSDPFSYTVRPTLFRGESTVKNGVFKSTFILPKNNLGKMEQGKVLLYAQPAKGVEDYSGVHLFKLDKTKPAVKKENQPPIITGYINDKSFKDGSTVGKSSILFLKLKDESGINIYSDGKNYNLSLQLDSIKYDLSSYYTAETDNYQKGVIAFPLLDLKPGNHKAVISAMDVYGNASSKTITFKVGDKPEIFIFESYIYPNPTTVDGKLYFEHDREGETLEIEAYLYNTQGAIIHQNQGQILFSPRSVEFPVMGNVLPESGIYFFRAIIKSKIDNAVKEIVKKVVISK